MLDDVTRARLAAQHVEQAEGGFCETCGSLWEWPCAVRALLTAQAQAAPVLAALRQWVDADQEDAMHAALELQLAAKSWRAAWEE